MKIRFLLLTALAGTLLLTGCTTQKDDGPPPPRGQKDRNNKKKPPKRSGRRDPVDDMFFGLSKKDDTPDFSASDLSKRERKTIRESRKWQDDEMRELRSRHDRFDEDRKARKRWVYGLKPED